MPSAGGVPGEVAEFLLATESSNGESRYQMAIAPNLPQMQGELNYGLKRPEGYRNFPRIARMASTTPAREIKPPFKQRFLAWWEGVELDELTAATVAKSAAQEKDKARKVKIDRKPSFEWETPRIKVLQAIWGQGFSMPGDKE